MCVADYRSLEHDTFLNDIIIDFYLTWLFHEVLRPEDRATVHLFSTMFYKRLTSTHKAKDSEVQEAGLSSAQKKHARVKGWTKNVNLFEKNFVVFPICEHSHWYLVIAIRPRLITLPVDSEERSIQVQPSLFCLSLFTLCFSIQGEPLFLVLDSLGGTKSGAVTNIRHYLAQEWAAKEAPRHPGRGEVTFTAREMRTLRPKKPEQENFSDCGIYLLYYVEKMFGRYECFINCLNIFDLMLLQSVSISVGQFVGASDARLVHDGGGVEKEEDHRGNYRVSLARQAERVLPPAATDPLRGHGGKYEVKVEEADLQ